MLRAVIATTSMVVQLPGSSQGSFGGNARSLDVAPGRRQIQPWPPRLSPASAATLGPQSPPSLDLESIMLRISSRHARLAITILAASTVAACQRTDPRVEKLATGITRDSALVILNDGTAPANGVLPHVVSSGDMLVNSASYTVLYYSDKLGEGMTAADVKQRDVTPLIIQNGVLVGWGWEFFNNMATQTHFATPEFRKD